MKKTEVDTTNYEAYIQTANDAVKTANGAELLNPGQIRTAQKRLAQWIYELTYITLDSDF